MKNIDNNINSGTNEINETNEINKQHEINRLKDDLKGLVIIVDNMIKNNVNKKTLLEVNDKINETIDRLKTLKKDINYKEKTLSNNNVESEKDILYIDLEIKELEQEVKEKILKSTNDGNMIARAIGSIMRYLLKLEEK